MRMRANTAEVPTPLELTVFRNGYGTWEPTLGMQQREWSVDVLTPAIDAGFGHFDSAQMYETEEILRDAVAKSGVDAEAATARHVPAAPESSWRGSRVACEGWLVVAVHSRRCPARPAHRCRATRVRANDADRNLRIAPTIR